MPKTKPVKKENTPLKAQQVKKTASKEVMKPFMPEKYQTPVFLAVILIAILIFFNEGLFGGKVFYSPDNIASASFNTFLNDAKTQGIFPMWIPYIFCGMPSFAALVPHLERMYDFSHAIWVTVRDILYKLGGENPVWEIVLFYIIFGLSFYFLAEYKFKNKLIALFCSLAAVFVTPIIQMIIVGHNSKLIAVMMFPLIFLFLEKIYDHFADTTNKKNYFKILLYFGLLVFFLHVQMSSNHIQMLFYFNFGIGIYLLYRLIYNIVKKTNVSVSSITIGIFILALALSAMMYADSYLSTKEYSKYSTRGVPSIVNQTAEERSKSENTDYEYATNWSFSPGEVMTFFFPSWEGFGDIEYQGQRTNIYWGQMPFTTSPMYFGVLIMLLGFIGIYYNFRKNVLVQALTVISFISLILSFGRTVPVLYDIFYYHMPYFSSFRAPVMIHILINVAFAILAGFGIRSIIETAKDKNASVRFISNAKFIFPILALPFVFSLIGFEGFYSGLVSSSPLAERLQSQVSSPQQLQQYLGQVSTIAYSNIKSEMLVISILLLLCYGTCYLYVKGSIKYNLFIFGTIIFMMFDLWHIDFKTLEWNTKTDVESVFKTPDYIDWILKNEKDLNSFRVMHINKGQPVRENTLAYWRLSNLYGYQGAKLRIIQDLDDVVGLENPPSWNITNTKYIISDKPSGDSAYPVVFKGSKYVLFNRNYLPRAFFVSSYKVASGIDILNNIKDNKFDPRQTAFFETDPALKTEPVDSTAKVNVTSYSLHDITLDAQASGNNLLFVSEMYYPAGWKAFIDGNETPVYKTDYLFRSIVVPKGKHSIEFKFNPETYYLGKKVAIGSNFVLIAFVVVAIAGIFIKKKKAEPSAEQSTEK